MSPQVTFSQQKSNIDRSLASTRAPWTQQSFEQIVNSNFRNDLPCFGENFNIPGHDFSELVSNCPALDDGLNFDITSVPCLNDNMTPSISPLSVDATRGIDLSQAGPGK